MSDYNPQKDGELSYLAAIEAKKRLGKMGDWEQPKPDSKEGKAK